MHPLSHIPGNGTGQTPSNKSKLTYRSPVPQIKPQLHFCVLFNYITERFGHQGTSLAFASSHLLAHWCIHGVKDYFILFTAVVVAIFSKMQNNWPNFLSKPELFL